MSPNLLYVLFSLLCWAGIACLIGFLYHLLFSFSALHPEKGARRKAAFYSLVAAGVCFLLSATLPHSSNAINRATTTLYLPLFWPIFPFTVWASIACVCAALYLLVRTILGGSGSGLRHSAFGLRKSDAGAPHSDSGHEKADVGIRHSAFGIRHSAFGIPDLALGIRNPELFAILLWLLAAVTFFSFFKASGDTVAVATGSIPLTWTSILALLCLAIAALFAMAGTSQRLRLRGYAKVGVTHLVLLAGCVVFGVPFFWLVITSFKEDQDMTSAGGLVWVPRVQETVSVWDTVPPIFQTQFDGQSVQGEIILREPDNVVRLNVVSPPGMEGYSMERPLKALKQVPVDAPIVSGSYQPAGSKSPIPVTGYILQEFGNGAERVKILSPPGLAGQAFTALMKDLTRVRKVGFKWRNYSDALGYLPPEADSGLAYVRSTLIIVIFSVIGTLLSSSIVAYAFSRLRFPGRDLLFGVLLSTMMLPAAVTLLPRFLIFRQLGWIDTLYPLWAPAFFASAFNVFLLRQFFKSIPTELEDAGRIDGCGYLRSYWSVMLPQIKPALAVIGIWTFMGAWNDFMGPLIYINSADKMPISYAVQIFSTDHVNEPGLVMAFATMSLIPVLLLFFFAQRYFIEGVTLSGFGGR